MNLYNIGIWADPDINGWIFEGRNAAPEEYKQFENLSVTLSNDEFNINVVDKRR